MTPKHDSALAINGGVPVRSDPMPPRFALGDEERNKVLAEQVKSTEMEQQGAMEVGSQEAATFLQKQMFDKVEQQIAVAEAQRLLQEAQLGAQRQANDRLAELAPVRPAR